MIKKTLFSLTSHIILSLRFTYVTIYYYVYYMLSDISTTKSSIAEILQHPNGKILVLFIKLSNIVDPSEYVYR